MNRTDRFLKWFFGDTLFKCIQSRRFDRTIACDPITATLLIVGTTMSSISAAQAYKQSKQQAKTVAAEGALKARERDLQTRRLAAAQKTSFLSSGIALTGDGDLPDVVLQDTYKTGIEDVNLIKSNYNQQSKNIMGAARAKLMSDIGGIVLGVATVGSMSGAFSGTSALSNSQIATNAATSGTGGTGGLGGLMDPVSFITAPS